MTEKNQLLAKTKGTNGEMLKILSIDDKIFDLPDLSSTIDYSPSYMLEDEEWFVLDNFTSRCYNNELIENGFDSTSYNQITVKQYNKIEYLCSKQGDYFLFQKMYPTCILRRKWLIISDSPKLEANKPIIILNNAVDAVYEIKTNKLYFKRIETIKAMFKGIEELYREATQAEVDDFLKEDFIFLADDFNSEKVKTANRKRIAMAIDTLKKFTKEDKKQIFNYIKEYCNDVPVRDGSFVVAKEEHLKKILYGIEQRYYTTPIRKEKRLANSVLKIEP